MCYILHVVMLDETTFRRRIQETFTRVENAFENVDPDLAECEQSLGSLTITFADRSRCILSTQPSVRQLWLAMAAKGTAVHFNLENPPDGASYRWIDDKGKGIELLSFLEGYLSETSGTTIRLRA